MDCVAVPEESKAAIFSSKTARKRNCLANAISTLMPVQSCASRHRAVADGEKSKGYSRAPEGNTASETDGLILEKLPNHGIRHQLIGLDDRDGFEWFARLA